MLELGKNRGLLISAVAGLVTGLLTAWTLWEEAPPQRELATQALSASTDSGEAPAEEPAADEADPAEEAPDPNALPTELLDVKSAKIIEGRYVQDLGEDRLVEYTVIPKVQKRAAQILKQAQVPFGSVVAMEPHTGRVLAYVEHSTKHPELKNLAGLSNPPAASVFKVITTAALLEHARIAPDYEVCFHGGFRGFGLSLLKDDAHRDNRCQSLTEALGRSSNVIFGKLADRHLDAETLDAYAKAFAWGRDIPFVFPVQQSAARFTNERLTLARTAAGFYNTQLSPVHGALVAGAVANEGVMMAPKIIERYVVEGNPVKTREATPMGRAIRARTARVLANMMVSTTELGTGRQYFSKRDKSLKGIRVAAKTGSLSAEAEDGERHAFSWIIGFAPAENPRIAVAALVVNVGKWRIKSTYLAREVLESYFATVRKGDLTSAR